MKKKQNPASRNQKRIFIVDDHPIVRQGITMLINQEPDLLVCGEAEEAHQALELIVASKPDLSIVDLSLKESHGIELIKNIQREGSGCLILVLSMYHETLYAQRALQAGAMGYVMKHEATEEIVTAIRQVLKGEIYLSDSMKTRLLDQLVRSPHDISRDPIASLSDRELEVFQFIGQGYTTRQIAEMLHLSIKTIESYRARIKEKLNLENATELVQRAIQWGQSRGTN